MSEAGAVSVLKAIKENERSALQCLGLRVSDTNSCAAASGRFFMTPHEISVLFHIQGVQLKKLFEECLEQTQEVHPDLQVVTVQQVEAPPKKAALDILFEHLRDSGQTPVDVFGVEEAIAPKWINKTAFTEMLEVRMLQNFTLNTMQHFFPVSVSKNTSSRFSYH